MVGFQNFFSFSNLPFYNQFLFICGLKMIVFTVFLFYVLCPFRMWVIMAVHNLLSLLAIHLHKIIRHESPSLPREERKKLIFQQDDASCHSVKLNVSYHSDQVSFIVKWHALYPNFNPIKNACTLTPPLNSTLVKLKEAVMDAWEKIPYSSLSKFALRQIVLFRFWRENLQSWIINFLWKKKS